MTLKRACLLSGWEAVWWAGWRACGCLTRDAHVHWVTETVAVRVAPQQPWWTMPERRSRARAWSTRSGRTGAPRGASPSRHALPHTSRNGLPRATLQCPRGGDAGGCAVGRHMPRYAGKRGERHGVGVTVITQNAAASSTGPCGSAHDVYVTARRVVALGHTNEQRGVGRLQETQQTVRQIGIQIQTYDQDGSGIRGRPDVHKVRAGRPWL